MKHTKKKQYSPIIIFLLLIIFAYQEYISYSNDTTDTNDINKQNTTISTDLKVYYFDVGQADSILITTNNHNMLIDAGNNEDGELLVDYISNTLNISTFDYIIGTHPHEDHIGGMDDIINNFTINTIYLPKKTTTTKTFTDVLDAIENKNLSITIPDNDEIFYLGEAKIEVIYNGSNETSDLNECSIILKLTYGNNTFLFTGDTTSSIEKTLLEKDLSSDVLKIAHHGSPYSTTAAFLKKVNPKYAIISVGENDYNHPSDIILNRLKTNKIETYRTDELGTIIVTSNGNNITITSEKTNTNGE